MLHTSICGLRDATNAERKRWSLMTEDQLCEFVERMNILAEETLWIGFKYQPPKISERNQLSATGMLIIELADDLMDTIDDETPQWHEAQATDDRDGTVYYARTTQKAGFWFAGTWLPENYYAQERANYLATR